MRRTAITTLGISFLFLVTTHRRGGNHSGRKHRPRWGDTTGLLEITSQHYVERDAARSSVTAVEG